MAIYPTNFAYSFIDVTVTISGPGGSGTLSDGGAANEGISLEFHERVVTMWGADGNWLHTLHAARGGRVTVRLMKNGVANALLNSIFDYDTVSSANVGKNLITVVNPVTGDSFVCIGCAGTKKPNTTYATEATSLEWVFNAGIVDGVYGTGTPAITGQSL